ncbi:MAG: hypothetical protein V7697_29490 [Rhodococcus erythropolis]
MNQMIGKFHRRQVLRICVAAATISIALLTSCSSSGSSNAGVNNTDDSVAALDDSTPSDVVWGDACSDRQDVIGKRPFFDGLPDDYTGEEGLALIRSRAGSVAEQIGNDLLLQLGRDYTDNISLTTEQSAELGASVQSYWENLVDGQFTNIGLVWYGEYDLSRFDNDVAGPGEHFCVSNKSEFQWPTPK